MTLIFRWNTDNAKVNGFASAHNNVLFVEIQNRFLQSLHMKVRNEWVQLEMCIHFANPNRKKIIEKDTLIATMNWRMSDLCVGLFVERVNWRRHRISMQPFTLVEFTRFNLDSHMHSLTSFRFHFAHICMMWAEMQPKVILNLVRSHSRFHVFFYFSFGICNFCFWYGEFMETVQPTAIK